MTVHAIDLHFPSKSNCKNSSFHATDREPSMRSMYGIPAIGAAAGSGTTSASEVCLNGTGCGDGPSSVTRSTLAKLVERDLMLASPAAG